MSEIDWATLERDILVEKRTLKIVRQRIEANGIKNVREKYHFERDRGDDGWGDYMNGIGDALKTVDELIDL